MNLLSRKHSQPPSSERTECLLSQQQQGTRTTSSQAQPHPAISAIQNQLSLLIFQLYSKFSSPAPAHIANTARCFPQSSAHLQKKSSRILSALFSISNT